MSDVKIQHDPQVPADAISPEAALTADVEQKSRSGFSGRQNQMADSIGRGSEVFASSQSIEPRFHKGQVNGVSPAPEAVTDSGMSVAGVSVTVQHVDQRCIEGSYSGDSRKHGAPAILPNNPAPREPKGQSKLCSSKLD